MTRAYIVGNSHVESMRRAVRKWPQKARDMTILRLGDEKKGEEWISAKALIALGRKSTVPLFLSRPGALHNHVSLFEPPEDFNILSPGDLRSRINTVVPRRLFENWVLDEHFGGDFHRRLAKAWKGRLHFLSIPPPKQSHAYLHDRLSRRSLAAQHIGAVRQSGFGNARLRLDIWQIEQDIVRQWAMDHGVGFVAAPTKALNEDGFLARRYYEADLTHANLAYGLEMLHDIDQVVRTHSGD